MRFARKIKPFFSGFLEETKEQKKCLLPSVEQRDLRPQQGRHRRQHGPRVGLLAIAVSETPFKLLSTKTIELSKY